MNPNFTTEFHRVYCLENGRLGICSIEHIECKNAVGVMSINDEQMYSRPVMGILFIGERKNIGNLIFRVPENFSTIGELMQTLSNKHSIQYRGIQSIEKNFKGEERCQS